MSHLAVPKLLEEISMVEFLEGMGRAVAEQIVEHIKYWGFETIRFHQAPYGKLMVMVKGDAILAERHTPSCVICHYDITTAQLGELLTGATSV